MAIKIIELKHCVNFTSPKATCPHVVGQLNDYHCKLKSKVIETGNKLPVEIPEWCPLVDAQLFVFRAEKYKNNSEVKNEKIKN